MRTHVPISEALSANWDATYRFDHLFVFPAPPFNNLTMHSMLREDSRMSRSINKEITFHCLSPPSKTGTLMRIPVSALQHRFHLHTHVNMKKYISSIGVLFK